MVFFFPALVESEKDAQFFMGKDKFENEELIKYHFPQDIWFHVNSLSSAHLYIRRQHSEEEILNLQTNFETKSKYLSSIPDELLEVISQLTKENSIQGKKEKSVRIIYTMASNLKKTGDMEVGQVSYYDNRLVKYYNVSERNTSLVNSLNKRKNWVDLDFKKERDNLTLKLEKYKSTMKKKKQEDDLELKKKYEQERNMKHYAGFFDDDKNKSKSSKTKEVIKDEDIWGGDESDEELGDEYNDFI